MSDAVHSLRVSYGLVSQDVIDLPLPARQASDGKEDTALLLSYSRLDGKLSIQPQQDTDDVDYCEDCSIVILAELFRGAEVRRRSPSFT